MSLLHTRFALFAALMCSLFAATATHGATLPTGFAETRLQNVYTKEKGLVDTKSIQSFPVSVGIVF